MPINIRWIIRSRMHSCCFFVEIMLVVIILVNGENYISGKFPHVNHKQIQIFAIFFFE